MLATSIATLTDLGLKRQAGQPARGGNPTRATDCQSWTAWNRLSPAGL